MDKFSVIIPTMWKCDILKLAIKEYNKSKFIDEIIIVDNDPQSKFEIEHSEKIKYLSEGKNIYVNPAWNWGVVESKNEHLIFANDDICINDLDSILIKFCDIDLEIIGLDGNNINSNLGFKIKHSIGSIPKGYGYFFHLKKSNYIPIPNDLKIFYGDVILYNSLKKRYTFYYDNIILKKSVTSNLFIDEYHNSDRPNFKNKYEKIYRLK